jgi:RNA polymerase sigma-70 factor (ECF subfamily)
MSDLSEKLTLALRSGDREAWNLVVRSETTRLHGIAWAISRDSGLAEDAVQETFLRLVEGRVRRVRAGAARALLASMTARAAIDALRRREARRKREEAHGMGRSQEDTVPGPEKAVLDAELARSIDEALALLDPLTRAAVWLHVVEGHGVRDVARTFEMARSTAADRIRAGLSRLEETLRRRGLASVLTLGWAALLGKSAIETHSPELVDRLRALGDRLQPGMPAGHRAWTGRSALPRAAALAGAILTAGGVTLFVLHAPETTPPP